MDLIEFEKLLQKSFFYKSYSSAKLWIDDSNFVELAFLGRSNSGKSSLVNSILGRKSLAKTSRTPGKTKLINVFAVPNQFSLVDLPGFGYSKASHAEHEKMMNLLEDYLNETKNLKHLFLLLDSRRNIPSEELHFIETCKNKNIKVTLIRTKSDKLNQKEKNQSLKETEKLKVDFIYASSLTGKGIPALKQILLDSLELGV